MGFIYLRTNKVNGKKYVGQATDLEERQRKWNCLKQPYAGIFLNRARAKYGLNAFDFEILKECKDEELNQWEMYYIKELNTKAPNGYNLTDGGDGKLGCPCSEETKKKIADGNRGKKHSEEAKKKMSEQQKGENNSFYGKHHSEESKQKMSEAKKGKTPWNKGKTNIYSEETKKKMSEVAKTRIYTEERRKKLSEAGKGRKHSEETKLKISESHKGKLFTEEHKRKLKEAVKNRKSVFQLDKETNTIIAEFPSIMEVEKQFGFGHSNISKCCKGEQKTAYGFIWKYKESVA